MSATTIARGRQEVSPRAKSIAKSKVQVSARTQNRILNMTVQGSWVFGLVFVATYVIGAISGHVMMESQRASVKALSPVLTQVRESELEHRTASAVDGSMKNVMDWARSRGWSQLDLKKTYVASR
ncbi:MAG: hypothetical protein WCK51_13930 [Armatimonadota bacterium]